MVIVVLIYFSNCLTLHKKCLYSELFWSAFSRIRNAYGEILRSQSKCGKMRTRITPNMDTFHAVLIIAILSIICFNLLQRTDIRDY